MTFSVPISLCLECAGSGSPIKRLVAEGQNKRPKRSRIWRGKHPEPDPDQLELPFDDATLWGMAKKTTTKHLPKLTDAERHKRFVEMAREVDASEDPREFDKAFKKVILSKDAKNRASRDRKA
jgi:hypothetical protein